jgi:molecular chaperone HtpG
MSDTGIGVETLEYRTEVKQLLDILAHSLYTDRDIFLRELISNASDALNRVQFEMLTNHDVIDPDAPLGIRIAVDSDAHTITITDTGIGMNHDEMIENLGTIAHSGAKAFMQQAQEGQSLEEIIGQFGVGFYSVFTVADEVSVTSRSFRDGDTAWTWRSTGDSRFELEPADKETRGTEITIKLKEDAAEYASVWRIEQIIKKHSDYVSFPIYVEDVTPAAEDADTAEQDEEKAQATPVNRQTALWRQSPSEVSDEEYDEFYRQLTFDFNPPLEHIHMVADMPVNLRSVLYIPAKREGNLMNPKSDHGLRLYSRKVLIQERNKDLLPEYLRFVDGVVDSEDLPLNVSREAVQSNPVMRRMRKALTGRLLKELKNLAENEPEKFAQFWQEFGVFIKEGVATDFTDRESLTELLRFHSTVANDPDSWTTLAEYIERMGEEQQEIYYVLGEDLKSAQRSPHLDYFRAHDLEVLLLIDPIDGFMISNLREYDGKPLRNVDDAGLELPDNDADEAESEESSSTDEMSDLVARFKSVLGEEVVDVRESKQLVSSPSRLVSPSDSFDRDLQRVRRFMEEDYEAPKKILEINARHPILVNLNRMVAAGADDELIDVTVRQLFDNARILDGLLTDPTDLVARVEALMAKATES